MLGKLARLDSRTWAGRLVRWPLSLVPRDAAIPVLSGPLRGARWIVGALTHGCWVGTYERNKQAAVVRFTRPGAVFYDLGANAGFYTLLAARLGARVVAVEPLPRNLDYLRRHIALNRCTNVQIFEGVVVDAPGGVSLAADAPSTAHVATEGIRVKATTLDEMVGSSGYAAPSVIKCDVEGSEMRVLQGGRHVFTTHRPILLLSVHSEQLKIACTEQLSDWGYHVEPDPTDANELIATV